MHPLKRKKSHSAVKTTDETLKYAAIGMYLAPGAVYKEGRFALPGRCRHGSDSLVIHI